MTDGLPNQDEPILPLGALTRFPGENTDVMNRQIIWSRLPPYGPSGPDELIRSRTSLLGLKKGIVLAGTSTA